jgi:uncharacterized LabA/DUF88 family protein
MKPKERAQVDRLAVLIDADNASAKKIESLLKEVSKFGAANVKRIYGDWTKPNLSAWKDKLNQFALQPMQQFRYTTGKNSSDSALIIDAMDLLHTRNFDGFCIVSSDSDYTRLACRIREAGLVVYGIGEKKTPEAFVRACDKFIYTEILDTADHQPASSSTKPAAKSDAPAEPAPSSKQVSTQAVKEDQELQNLLKAAYEAIAGEDGWAHLSSLRSQITKMSPAFDSRNYGFSKLGELIEQSGWFEIKKVPGKKDPVAKVWYIKLLAK